MYIYVYIIKKKHFLHRCDKDGCGKEVMNLKRHVVKVNNMVA